MMSLFSSVRSVWGLAIGGSMAASYALWKLSQKPTAVKQDSPSESVKDLANLTMKVHKLDLVLHGTSNVKKIYFYAPYGILDGNRVIHPDLGDIIFHISSNVDGTPRRDMEEQEFHSVLSPITRSYFMISPNDLDAFSHQEKQLSRAACEWELKERIEGDLGYVNRIQLEPLSIEDRQKVAYYTEIVLIALGKGLSMPELYHSGPNPCYGRIEDNGGIAYARDGNLMTPLGKIAHCICPGRDGSEKNFLSRIETEFDPQNRITILKTNTKGDEIPCAIPIPTIECLQSDIKQFQNEWERIRDHVYWNVNLEIKSKSRTQR